MRVTIDTLARLGACADQRDKFAAQFPDGVTVTPDLAASLAGYDIDWAARNLLGPPALAEYERVRDSAWAEYERVCAPARAEYERVRDAAWAEYERACAPARAEYERVCAETFCRLAAAE